ncbi:BA75_04403T0 [Komagataella pastoris]|uniref:BA75_04403T0 n=1 Tax=Komagataella pastoris TaxID=4922 RepID=A0A1B2JHT9_PICPA|nr:BA75_04403T0 [Komagataella pastoris]
MFRSELSLDGENIWTIKSAVCAYRQLQKLPPALSSTLPIHIERLIKDVSLTQSNSEDLYDGKPYYKPSLKFTLPVMLSPILPDRYGGFGSSLMPLLSPTLPPRLESKVASHNLSIRADRLQTRGNKMSQKVTENKSSKLGALGVSCIDSVRYKVTSHAKREQIVPQKQKVKPIPVLQCKIKINYTKLAQFCRHRSDLKLLKGSSELFQGVLAGLDALLLFCRAYSDDILVDNWQEMVNYAHFLQSKNNDQIVNGVLLLLQCAMLRHINKLLVSNKNYKSIADEYITNDLKAEDLFRKGIVLVPNSQLSQITEGNFRLLAPYQLKAVQKLVVGVLELKTNTKRLSWCAVE